MRKIVFFLAFFFSSIGLSFASEFPIDAVTTHYNISSAGTGTLGF